MLLSKAVIRPEALVLQATNGPVLEGLDIEHDEFSLSVGQGKGWLIFQRVNSSPSSFQLLKLLPPYAPHPYPQVSLRGVLWSRRAALEAHQGICAYQAAIGLTP